MGWLKVKRNPVLEREARDTGLTRGCDFVLLCDHRPGVSPRSPAFPIKRVQASTLPMDSSMDNHVEWKLIDSHQTLQSSLGSLVVTQDFLSTESPQPGSQAGKIRSPFTGAQAWWAGENPQPFLSKINASHPSYPFTGFQEAQH